MAGRKKRDYRAEARDQVYGLGWVEPPRLSYQFRPNEDREALVWLCGRVNDIARHLGYIYAALDIDHILQEEPGLIKRRIEEETAKLESQEKAEKEACRLKAETRRKKRADQA